MVIEDGKLKAFANNFTLIRIILASAVIITHSYWRVYGIEGQDHFSAFLGKPISAYAVDGFFFLSGFLVYPSLLRRKKLWPFAQARLARLWPALAVSVLLVVAVGAVITTASLAEYFGGPTRRFIIMNLLLQSKAYTLTGLFCGNELCNVNGSLWTIAWEVRCYALLGLLFMLGLTSERAMKWFVLPATVLFAVIWGVLSANVTLPENVTYYLGMTDRLWGMFALGIAAYIFRTKIHLSWGILALLFVASLAEGQTGYELHIGSIFIGYAVLCGGILTARHRAIAGHWPDYSYGMYIYAFPVMMVLAAQWRFENDVTLALANAAATLPLAILSWHYIEKPVLDRMKQWSSAKRAG